jgi:membrane glycosyltransferase
MGYMASPFWLMQLVVGIALVLQVKYARPEYFTSEFTLVPVWPRFDPERALALFGLTMAILLAPKLFGWLLTLFNGPERRACGGAIRLTLSTIIEIIMSALLAPIMMVIQSGSVFQIVLGRDTGWNPQRRDDGSIPFSDIVRRHRGHTLLGVVTGVTAFLIATSLFAWMSPTILGLLLAIPLSWASGQLAIGLWLKRRGLLLTPEEGAPPAIASRANALQRDFAESRFDDADGLLTLHQHPELMEAHVAMLPPAPSRQRGSVDPERAVAEAKLIDARTIDEAMAWLKPKERMVVLHDRALLSVLARLEGPSRAAALAAQ